MSGDLLQHLQHLNNPSEVPPNESVTKMMARAAVSIKRLGRSAQLRALVSINTSWLERESGGSPSSRLGWRIGGPLAASSQFTAVQLDLSTKR